MDASPGASNGVSTVTDSIGLTWRHWLYFVLITLVLLADGMEVTMVSHTFPSLAKEWGVSVGGGITLVVTGGFIAMAVGALVAGRLADLFGRKSVLVSATLLFAVTTALGATSANFTAFTAWRFLACLGIGAVMPTGITLLADLAPARQRASLVAAGYAGVGLGTVVGAGLAGLLIPTGGWRALLVAGGVVSLVLALLLAFVVPESPAYYAAHGAVDKAKQVLARLAPGTDLSAVVVAGPSDDVDKQEAFAVILSRRFAATTVLLWLFGFFSLGTQLLIAQYLPTLLQQPVPGLTTVQSSTIVGTYGFASVVGGLALSGILARVSRYRVIGFALALSVVVALAIGLAPDPGFGTLLLLLTIAGLILPTAFGPTRNILATAAYPARVRGTGVGSTELCARAGSAVGGLVGGTLIGAGLGLAGLFLTLLLPIGVLLSTLAGLKFDARRSGADSIAGIRDEDLSLSAPETRAGALRAGATTP
ncbi:MFS transporter [Nocardia sp. NPDC051750]|uniref:MFS transporter n=1 Tax=Nocardia sp. NPDC051750 TaxID=3364325 RepID=UPI0037A741E9